MPVFGGPENTGSTVGAGKWPDMAGAMKCRFWRGPGNADSTAGAGKFRLLGWSRESRTGKYRTMLRKNWQCETRQMKCQSMPKILIFGKNQSSIGKLGYSTLVARGALCESEGYCKRESLLLTY